MLPAMNAPARDLHRWDLSTLYPAPDDPSRAADREAIFTALDAFVSSYRGRLGELDGPGFERALQELAELHRLARRYAQYASLRFSVDTNDAVIKAEHSEMEAVLSKLNQELAFLGVEIAALGPEHFANLPGKEALETHAWWIQKELLFAPYTLSEDAERTIARKNVTAKTAWVNLYMEATAGMSFPLQRVEGGPVEELTRSEVSSLRTDEDRALRRRAFESLTDVHRKQAHVLTSCFNAIFEDHRSDTEARGYDDVLTYTVLRDGLTPEIVRALIDTVTDAFPTVCHRWHALRQRVLDLPDYGFEDTYMAAFGAEPDSPWEEARGLVEDAFSSFSPEAGDWAKHALDHGWVDVFPRPGKRSGAFCSSAVAPDHAFVMLNHAGKLDDTFTLAHEFGHAWHFTRAAREQDALNLHCGTPMAETASIFAEIWLHEHLMQDADPTLQRALLARQIDDAMGSAFRQITYVNWELKAHARRAEGSVSAEEYSQIWLEELGRMMGPGVKLDAERDKWSWIMVPHFIFARFYCYSYAFGKMLTLALYDLWKERGDAFVDEYHAILTAGGSRPPAELFADLGLDLSDPAFWQRGIDVLTGYLDELEGLIE